MCIGAALVIAALLLFLSNRNQAQQAESAADGLLPEVIAQIAERSEMFAEKSVEPALRPVETDAPENTEIPDAETTPASDETSAPEITPVPTRTPQKYVDPYDKDMTVVEIKGEKYIGYVSIPELNLELPVMAEWSYRKLRKSPCHYAGSTKTDDLVIFAHNYSRHFGRLNRLSLGDEVIFTDMNGVITKYQVVDTDELSAYAVEEMTAGEYDLTLFTCTYGGRARVTVRCDRVE